MLRIDFPHHTGRNIPAYLRIAGLSIQMAYAWRVDVAIALIGLLLKVYLLKVVFVAVYAERGSVDGISLREVVTFVTLVNLQVFLLAPVIGEYVRW